MVNLRSGKNCDVKPVLVPQTQRGQKRKNPKQCFEGDSEDELPNVLERKTKIFMKKCDMCGSLFGSEVHLKDHISKHPEPDLFIRPDGLPITFVMPPTSCKEKNSKKGFCNLESSCCKARREVKCLVEEGGGALLEAPEGDNWVSLVTSKDNFEGHSEAFSASYVKDCVQQRRIVPDLAMYRVGSMAPRFRENPLEVMLGFRGWTESTPIDGVKPKTRDIYDMEMIREESNVEAFESFLRETASLELSEDKTESLTDPIRNFESEADVLEDVQEWARTELAKTEMSEYLPKVQNTVVEEKQGRIRPVRTKSHDEGFESDDEDLDDWSAKRKGTIQNSCHQDEATKVVSEPRKTFLYLLKGEKAITGHRTFLLVPCQYCRRSFKYDKSLMNHVKKVHNKTAQSSRGVSKCNICDFVCVNAYSLWQHLKTHSGERPYKCKQCEFASNQTGDLRRHLRTHSGTKPYKCNQCVYAASQSGHLRRHMKTHIGEKSQKCNLCNYATGELYNLKRHLKTHFGEETHK